jgi:hypothetical protein
VRALTEQQVRRSFVNCSQGEAKGLALPKDFGTLDWAELELLGWRDPKAPLRGYLVLESEAGLLGADLGCAQRVRTEIPPWLQDRNPAEVVAERAAELRERVQGFVDAVRR